MMSHWNGTIIGPGHVRRLEISHSNYRWYCVLTVRMLLALPDRAREPHLQPQDRLWRELPRLPTLRAVCLTGEPAVCQPS